MIDLSRGQVWKSRLHERLKMHLWRIAANVLPTKDVISQFANVEVECTLCNLFDESSFHIFALCPIAKSLWFRSQWGVKTDSLGFASIHDFINFLFSPSFAKELIVCQREDFLFFGAILCNVIWKQKNLFLFEGFAVKVEELSFRISKLFLEHKGWRGELVFACSKRLNTIFPFQAEAEAIKWALTLAANLEFEAIIIESDSQVVQYGSSFSSKVVFSL
ncbi:hypothetical protein SO802_031217 [Lithocarpus litseifolius]|uniref:Reverse transcriptase zinc-binding domain-containing protein n=1 Tax=Lithocarpus litseifolius TaxID=425828 RepID=A0AAW2BJK7_9ROSI